MLHISEGAMYTLSHIITLMLPELLRVVSTALSKHSTTFEDPVTLQQTYTVSERRLIKRAVPTAYAYRHYIITPIPHPTHNPMRLKVPGSMACIRFGRHRLVRDGSKLPRNLRPCTITGIRTADSPRVYLWRDISLLEVSLTSLTFTYLGIPSPTNATAYAEHAGNLRKTAAKRRADSTLLSITWTWLPWGVLRFVLTPSHGLMCTHVVIVFACLLHAIGWRKASEFHASTSDGQRRILDHLLPIPRHLPSQSQCNTRLVVGLRQRPASPRAGVIPPRAIPSQLAR